mgnify:CR=1 FL=1
MAEGKLEGTWVVTSGSFGRLIGKLCDDDKPHKALEGVSCIKLCPCFEHDVMMQQIPGPDGKPQLAKGSLTTNMDSLVHEAPVYVFWEGSRVTFFEEMHENDRLLYEKFVTDALEQSKMARAAREAGPAGPRIQLAGQMPGGGIGGGPRFD